jgi:acyl-CoA dehydrogenase
MDFEYPPKVQALRRQLEAFMERYLLPYNAAWHHSVSKAVYPPPFIEDL